jgi:acyl carrier protein
MKGRDVTESNPDRDGQRPRKTYAKRWQKLVHDGKVLPLLNQPRCPICGNSAVAEFFEPRGAALCMQCGAILRRLRNRLVFSYHLEPDRITLDTSFRNDLDSLDVVELVLALEEELGVKISGKAAENIKTVEDLVRLVRRQKSE